MAEKILAHGFSNARSSENYLIWRFFRQEMPTIYRLTSNVSSPFSPDREHVEITLHCTLLTP
jgi:hypothetical protein